MTDRPRVTRPKPERTDPVRNWSTLLGGAPPPDGQPAAGIGDVVSRSVDLGYRVVDEYVRQGQRAAERVSGRGSPAAAVTDLQDAAARMASLGADFLRVWFELMGLAAAGGLPGAGALGGLGGGAAPVPPAAAATAPPAASAPRARVRLEVAARQPVDAVLDLRPEAVEAELVAHALRAADPALPALAEVRVTRDDDGAVTLRVAVPDGQPAGTYNGLVVDARSSRPVGTVSVRIAAP